MDKEELIKKEAQYIMNTYTRWPILFVRGKGMTLVDESGKEYLDFVSGLAVTSLGHSNPNIVDTISGQAETLIHTSNLYYTKPQVKLAEKLINLSFSGKVFFSNSGAEANEAAIKIARKHAKIKFRSDLSAYEVITAENSFHGRTLATLAATGQPVKQKPFLPMPDGFSQVPYNDFKVMKNKISKKTCAIMLELIQGEGGVIVADKEYIRDVRKLCDDLGLLLIIDEVQTGLGRTGAWFAYEHYGIKPDIMTLAKTLGGGLPLGVTIAGKNIADTLEPGDHGTTMGGSPLVCAVGQKVIEIIEEENLVKKTKSTGEYLNECLVLLGDKHSIVEGIRGMGLMKAVKFSKAKADQIVAGCLDKGVIVNKTSPDMIRLLPPMIVEEDDIDKLANVLDQEFEKAMD